MDLSAVSDELPRSGRSPGREQECGDRDRPQRKPAAQRARRKGDQCGDEREDEDGLRRVLGADPRDEQQADHHRADNRAEGVRRIDTPHESAGIAPRFGNRSQGERKARAPEDSGRQNGPRAADQIELELEPWAGDDRGIDRPEREVNREDVRGPGDPENLKNLATAQHVPCAVSAACDQRAQGAAEAETGEKHRQNN